LAKKYIENGNDVYIVTTREPKHNLEPLQVAEKLGIPKNKVIFTNRELKYKTINKMGIQLHFDDKLLENEMIEANCNCETFLVYNKNKTIKETKKI